MSSQKFIKECSVQVLFITVKKQSKYSINDNEIEGIVYKKKESVNKITLYKRIVRLCLKKSEEILALDV